MKFSGVMTALVTPFQSDGAVDLPTFRTLVRRQLDAGISGLVPCGTTGETPTLSFDEQDALIQVAVEEAAGEVPVLAGVGGSDTKAAVERAADVVALGVDALLVATPPYNKPTQEGIFRHYQAIAGSQPDTALCVYDVPGRTAVAIATPTFERLGEIDNVLLVKDATADLAKAAELRRILPDRVALLSGDDFTFVPHLAAGGVGCVSVASNLIPERMVALYQAFRDGDHARAAAENAALQPLYRALFIQANPIPVKTAMAHLGLMGDTLRLPLCELDAGPREVLLATLAAMGIEAG